MGQGQSAPRTGRTNAQQEQQQQQEQRAGRRAAAPRGTAERAWRARARFSPYGLFSSPAGGRPAGRATPAAETGPQQMSVDSIPPAEASEAAVPADSERPAAAAAADGGRPAPSERWRVSRVQLQAGNELISRMIGQSVISSVTQELERRNAVFERMGPLAVAAGLPGQSRRPASRLPRYTLPQAGRFELFSR
ncbi:hypothetical protein IWQ56_005405, partial [Coemansia nantahalensis]